MKNGIESKVFGRNVFGAFADAAILFPLIAALTLQSDFSGVTLLATAGIAYWVAGLVFRVPMPVQPLKSIAIAAVATGASSAEVRIAGACLGLACLLLTLVDVNRLAEKVSASLVHGLQLALGILLISQGVRLAGATPSSWLGLLALVAVMLVLPGRTGFPVLGWVATFGLAWTVARGFLHPELSSSTHLAGAAPMRIWMIASLALPQVALTLGNSVLGTRDVALRSFGKRAYRVTVRALLTSIGIGNMASAAVGGLPFCHGAGGMTAHVRGGADHWCSNAIIGTTLLVLAAVAAAGGSLALRFPPLLLGSLLAATGAFHLTLAAPTWSSSAGKLKLLAMGSAAVFTHNMLWVVAVGIVGEFAQRALAARSAVPAGPYGKEVA